MPKPKYNVKPANPINALVPTVTKVKAVAVTAENGTQPLALGMVADGSALVDLETGEVNPTGPPSERLNDAGKLRLIQMILSGYDNDEIADALVKEGFIIRYSAKAVSVWREKPEVQYALSNRYRRAFQVGIASKERRIKALDELTEALRQDILVQDAQTGQMRIRRTRVDAFGRTVDISMQHIAMLIKEYRESIRQVSEMIDDPPGKEVNVNVHGNVQVNHAAQMMGMKEATRDDLMRKLQEMTGVLEGQFREEEELPASLVNGNATQEQDA